MAVPKRKDVLMRKLKLQMKRLEKNPKLYENVRKKLETLEKTK